MNRRILKKLCKRAVPILIEKHRYHAGQFSLSDGTETVSCPAGMDRRNRCHGFLEPGPLPGTPVLWLKTSYEYDEWDCYLPSEILADLEAEERLPDDFWERQLISSDATGPAGSPALSP